MFHKKIHLSFSSAKTPTFCEAATENVVQNRTDTFISHNIHHFMYKNQNVSIFDISTIFQSIKRFCVDSAGNGQNLNYKCYISCPLFFGNFVSRFTTSYFIRDTPKPLHASITTHERSRPRLRLDFSNERSKLKKIKIM